MWEEFIIISRLCSETKHNKQGWNIAKNKYKKKKSWKLKTHSLVLNNINVRRIRGIVKQKINNLCFAAFSSFSFISSFWIKLHRILPHHHLISQMSKRNKVSAFHSFLLPYFHLFSVRRNSVCFAVYCMHDNLMARKLPMKNAPNNSSFNSDGEHTLDMPWWIKYWRIFSKLETPHHTRRPSSIRSSSFLTRHCAYIPLYRCIAYDVPDKVNIIA